MNYILFDDDSWKKMWPITLSRPMAEVFVGTSSMRHKWERLLEDKTSTLCAAYLQNHFPCKIEDENTLVNASVLPTHELVKEVRNLEKGVKLYRENQLIAIRLGKSELSEILEKEKEVQSQTYEELFKRKDFRNHASEYKITTISRPWELFKLNGGIIAQEFPELTEKRKSQKPSDTCTVIGKQLFLEEGAKAEACTFNTENGPIFIAAGAEIMEGATIRGPFFLGEGSIVKMGAKIYGDTSVGSYCKVGGEVSNSIIFDYSNKGHDGFIGNSVIGSWCNLGADTNSSNLKNNYGNVKVWDYEKEELIDSGVQFCGLIMGDHSKTAINTMLNTGTVVGVCSNIFGGGFPPKHIPSFTWGGGELWQEFRLDKAGEVAERMMSRREQSFTANESAVFKAIFDATAQNRLLFLR